MLRTIAIIGLTTLSFSTQAHAICGAELSFEVERENGYVGQSTIYNQGYGDRETSGKLKFSIPFGDNSCEKDLATAAKLRAERRDREADAMDQRIRNFNNIVKLCKENDIPNLCSRIPQMARELNID